MNSSTSERRGDRRLLGAIVAANTLIASNEIVTWSVLPAASADLHGDTLYGIAAAVVPLGMLASLLYGGHVIDRLGARRIGTRGVAVFFVAATVTATAPAMSVLVLARLIAGVGIGFTNAATAAAVAAQDERVRVRVLAVASSVWFPTAVIFPQIAAALRGIAGWRAAFLVVAFSACAAAVLMRALPQHVASHEDEPRGIGRTTAEVVGGGTLLVVALSGRLVVPLAAVLLVASLALCGHGVSRVVPRGTLRLERGLPSAIVLRGAWGFSVMALQAFETLALARVLHASAWVIGLALAAVELGIGIGGWLLARWHDRLGTVRALRTGAVVSAVGAFGFGAVVALRLPALVALLPLTVRHLGWGFGHNGSAEAVNLHAPVARRGQTAAAGVLSLTVGFMLGPAMAGAAFAHGAAFPGGVRGATMLATAISLVGFAFAFSLASRTRLD